MKYILFEFDIVYELDLTKYFDRECYIVNLLNSINLPKSKQSFKNERLRNKTV